VWPPLLFFMTLLATSCVVRDGVAVTAARSKLESSFELPTKSGTRWCTSRYSVEPHGGEAERLEQPFAVGRCGRRP